jgi:hypothetical protein
MMRSLTPPRTVPNAFLRWRDRLPGVSLLPTSLEGQDVNSRGGGGGKGREGEGDTLDVTVHGDSDRLETMLASLW